MAGAAASHNGPERRGRLGDWKARLRGGRWANRISAPAALGKNDAVPRGPWVDYHRPQGRLSAATIPRRFLMPMQTLVIGDDAPDFEADTTEGKIRFHEWLGNSWGVLFSHPKDFTPVCTTELGTMARLKPEFDKRNVKIVGLSVDPVDNHSKWANDIKETQGYAPNYPLIGDPE